MIEAERAAVHAELTATVARLVARAAAERWPIRADHCFLRIAYDNAVGAKWDTLYPKPGWRHLSLQHLAAALDIAGRIEATGRESLDPLNATSLAWRRQLVDR